MTFRTALGNLLVFAIPTLTIAAVVASIPGAPPSAPAPIEFPRG